MAKKLITAQIDMGDDFHSQVSGKTIEEVLEKINEYHTMSKFHKEHYTKKGTLLKHIKTGWFTKESCKEIA